ncbi:coatomer subunit alpha [Ilyodon furcidens]|uniref:Coatomer subunit alpha n=1 Tax=Ilyodon furcidens TaxID=33524 RepID=A0ABV0UVL7_9TELE
MIKTFIVRTCSTGTLHHGYMPLWFLNKTRFFGEMKQQPTSPMLPCLTLFPIFSPTDHCVHYYDLRNTKQPIMVFKGHRKAVSYAKFVNGEEIVSASTDSQLKLWNVNKPHCLRSFKGHINEKNFVGLASNGDYVACGSENNSLYLYYKGLSKTLLTFKFDTVKSVLDKDKKEDDTNEFVSAVCWRALPDGESNVLIAANSQGTIKVLELV